MSLEKIAQLHGLLDAIEESGEEYERQVRRCYEAILKPGDVAVDVGAYEGKHTISLGFATAPGGCIYLAEPNTGIHKVLHGRIECARHFGAEFEIFDGCISNVEGENVSFSIVPDKIGWSSLIPRANAGNVEELRVTTRTLDNWIPVKDHERVRFIKVDCEGAEFKVLEGASSIISYHNAIIHLEISPEALDVHSVRLHEFAAWISEKFVALDCAGKIFDASDALEAAFRSKGCFDFFFVSRKSSTFLSDVLKIKKALSYGFYGKLTDGSIPELQTELTSEFLLWAQKLKQQNGPQTGISDFAVSYISETPSHPAPSVIASSEKASSFHPALIRIGKNIQIIRHDNFELLEQMPIPPKFNFDLETSAHFEVDIETDLVNFETNINGKRNMTLVEISVMDWVFLLRIQIAPEKGMKLEAFTFIAGKGKRFLATEVNHGLLRARIGCRSHEVLVDYGGQITSAALERLQDDQPTQSVQINLNGRTQHVNKEAYPGNIQAIISSTQRLI
jgi:FkbM family methyltransferase